MEAITVKSYFEMRHSISIYHFFLTSFILYHYKTLISMSRHNELERLRSETSKQNLILWSSISQEVQSANFVKKYNIDFAFLFMETPYFIRLIPEFI